MNKTHYLFIVFFITNLISAQTRFEKGFYIDNLDTKIEGFIKNEDWKNNPTSFEFKENENSDVKDISIDYTKEFEITGISRYVRADVDIEKSSNKLRYMGNSREPQYKNERLFLKQLVNGSANLYIFEENGLEKFFYSANNSPIKQLVFIQYKANAEDMRNGASYDDISTNDFFRRQLWIDVRCETITQQNIKGTDYKINDLTKYFEKYNACKGDVPIAKLKEKKAIHNLKASVMYNISDLGVESSSPSYSPDFKNSSFGFGLEYELILPFKNNKWGVVVEPSYFRFKDEQTIPAQYTGHSPIEAKTDIKIIQLPLGLRHYFYLNNNSRIFLNAIGNLRIIGRDKNVVEFSDNQYKYEFAPTSFSFAFGAGYAYKKFSGEVRYYITSNISLHANIPMNFNSTSFIFRYELFGTKKS